MKFLSLFSGIGGFDLAFEQAGMTGDSVCEIDQTCQDILSRHFPNARLFDDIRKVGIATHERHSVDLICGGFPCQDLSIAGKRAGLAGERSGLWFEFARVIDELEPQWVVIENVPGLLSSNGGKDFAVIISWLAKRGYGVSWRILDAQYFGVPQRRRRVFVVASFGNGRAAEVLFERESGAGDTETGRKAGEDVAFSIRANPSHSGDKGNGGINTTLLPVTVPSLCASGRGTERAGESRGQDPVIPVYQRRGGFGWSEYDGQSPTLQAEAGPHQGGPERVPIVFSADRDGGDAIVGLAPTMKHGGDDPSHHRAYKKMAIAWQNRQQSGEIRLQDDTMPSVTQQWGTGGNNVPMVGVRRLTPVECERLQGFPDGWTDGQSDSTRYRQLGNAVAVPVVRWIGERIVTHDPS